MAENVNHAPFETTTAGPAEHSAAQPVSAEEFGLWVTEVLAPSGSASADGAEGDA